MTALALAAGAAFAQRPDGRPDEPTAGRLIETPAGTLVCVQRGGAPLLCAVVAPGQPFLLCAEQADGLRCAPAARAEAV